jgi:hypothetical protein
VSAADLLAPGERCLAAGKGLHTKPKPGVVEAVLGKRYMVLLDGASEAQPFGLKKVKRLGKPPAKKVVPGTGETEGWIAAIREQRPPTRLHIPDANVPAVEPGTPSVIRGADSVLPQFQWYPQPKPRKPSRSSAYLQHVRRHDCCNCGAFGPSDPDHVGPRGVGQKTSDYNCIPLCRACHRRRTDKNVLPEADKNFGGPAFDRTRSDTELIILRAQVQMLREWAEKNEKETP